MCSSDLSLIVSGVLCPMLSSLAEREPALINGPLGDTHLLLCPHTHTLTLAQLKMLCQSVFCSEWLCGRIQASVCVCVRHNMK